jgi:ergothioneine biosynthesis protein EgtB
MASVREVLIQNFNQVRDRTEAICEPLEVDDYQLQSIIQTSPPKWHLAHVSWFFEVFVLHHFSPEYKSFAPYFDFLFNSYYYTRGSMHPRADRGLLSRPTVKDVYAYRSHVNTSMRELLGEIDNSKWDEFHFRVTLGLHHEQQHQELMLMDIKHNFSVNPLRPAYRNNLENPRGNSRPMRWLERAGGIDQIGHASKDFAFDNETPSHAVLIQDHLLADRFVTNGEFLNFINDGGYADSRLWLSDGWTLIQREKWQHPLYWEKVDGSWMQFSLGGMRELSPLEPVCHLSFFEADAFARWMGKRLPLEAELETCLSNQSVVGNFSDSGLLHPGPAGETGQWYGDLWAWTASPYVAYPGFRPLAGSIGEYNGKFMSNQMVLKGGSCVTPHGHIRASYRNFFYPDERWAFTGVRLADDI